MVTWNKTDLPDNVSHRVFKHSATVHVRNMWVKAADHGDSEPLRSYMNGCVIEARKGCVMVSPFISPQEKMVMKVLLDEGHPFILLADNGFRNYLSHRIYSLRPVH